MKRRVFLVSFLLAFGVLAIAVGASSKPLPNFNRENGAATQQEIDPNSYYRLTTKWQGASKSLDVLNGGNHDQLRMADTGNFSGQNWKFTPVLDGYYRLTTEFQGPGKSLDVVNDGAGNNKLILGQTGKRTGQAWKITPVGGGFNRLTTNWQGIGKSLDVVNDGNKNNQLLLVDSGILSGQYWKITKVK